MGGWSRAGRLVLSQTGHSPEAEQSTAQQSKAATAVHPPAAQPSPDKYEMTSEVEDQSGECSQAVRMGRSRSEPRDAHGRA